MRVSSHSEVTVKLSVGPHASLVYGLKFEYELNFKNRACLEILENFVKFY